MTTNPPSPSATPEQIKERLARFMGWEDAPFVEIGKFNPLTDWNHWRMVEEKVLEDEELLREFTKLLMAKRMRNLVSSYQQEGMFAYMKAPLSERVDALISVLPDEL